MNVWDFIQDEIFGMKWLNRLIGSLLNACGLDTDGKLGGSIQFFIYDVIKIMVLLGVPDGYAVLNLIALGGKGEIKRGYTEKDFDFGKVHYEKY